MKKVVISEDNKVEDIVETSIDEDIKWIETAIENNIIDDYVIIDKAKAKRKKKLNKKLWISILVLTLSIIVLTVMIYLAYISKTNNYETPIALYVKYLNEKEYDSEERLYDMTNKLASKEVRQIREVMHNSKDYLRTLDSLNNRHEAEYEERLLEYGDDFEYSYTVKSKYRLSARDITEYNQDMQRLLDEMKYFIVATKDYAAKDWENVSEATGLNDIYAMLYINCLEELNEKLSPVKVRDGYRVICELKVTGERIPEPYYEEIEFIVLKVNGRWIISKDISTILSLGF